MTCSPTLALERSRIAGRHGSREDRQPVFEISTTPANEERLRTFYGRPRPGPRYSEEWRCLVQSSDLDDDIKTAISDLSVSIPGRSAMEVFRRLISIRAIYDRRGDLDHAVIAILSSLRTNFPSTRAWEPGYAPMLVRLESGEGHAPEEAKKVGQKMILSTGCSYADSVLIPALAKHGRFIDQE